MLETPEIQETIWRRTNRFRYERPQLQKLCEFLQSPVEYYDIATSSTRSLEIAIQGGFARLQPVVEDGFLLFQYSTIQDITQRPLLRASIDGHDSHNRFDPDGQVAYITDHYLELRDDDLAQEIESLLRRPHQAFVSGRRFLVDGQRPPGADELDLFTLEFQYPQEELDSLKKILLSDEAVDRGRSRNRHSFAWSLSGEQGEITPVVNGEYLTLLFRQHYSDSPRPLVWIKDRDEMWLSQFCLEICGPETDAGGDKMIDVIQNILRNPLLFFVADMGKRPNCVFCGRDLSFREVGYGPECAKKRKLVWRNEFNRRSAQAFPDCSST